VPAYHNGQTIRNIIDTGLYGPIFRLELVFGQSRPSPLPFWKNKAWPSPAGPICPPKTDLGLSSA